MKRHYLGLMGLLAMILMVACNKKEDAPPFDAAKQKVIDEAAIVKYIADSSITGMIVADTNGLRYKILARGTTPNDTIALQDRMNLNYVGRLTNGNIFDQGKNTTLRDARLDNLIPGWKTGLRKIAKGDSVLLIIPSSQGYGNRDLGSIPANSVLVFNVRLNDFYY